LLSIYLAILWDIYQILLIKSFPKIGGAYLPLPLATIFAIFGAQYFLRPATAIIAPADFFERPSFLTIFLTQNANFVPDQSFAFMGNICDKIKN